MSAIADSETIAVRELLEKIKPLRKTDNWTNFGYLALDYFCLTLIIGGAVAFAEYRSLLGIAWGWNVPIFALAIVLIGGLQHRLAGLGHEAAHFILLKNRFWNDLVGDVFCMFPILSTVHFYRLFHLAHHQYTNDRDHDPDLVNLGPGKRVDDFPMSRLRTIITVYFRAIVLPISFVRYQLEYLYVNTLGKGNNVYMRRVPDGDADRRLPRLGTSLGLIYVLGFNVGLRFVPPDRMNLVALGGMVAVWFIAAILPDRAFYRSPFREPIAPRVAGVMRLAFYTALLLGLAHLRVATGGKSAMYVFLLWVVPLSTSFMFFMLLRDIYQHTNADSGRLTNSRVFFTDPLTRWAVFVHGQGMHVPHHLFPAIPHYRLGELHRILKSTQADYAEQVVECHGTFANHGEAPTILDVLTEPRPTPHFEVGQTRSASPD